MVFNIWLDMFMVRMRAGQCQIIGVRLGVIPVQFLLTLPGFVAVISNFHTWQGNQLFIHPQPKVVLEINLATNNCNMVTASDKR